MLLIVILVVLFVVLLIAQLKRILGVFCKQQGIY